MEVPSNRSFTVKKMLLPFWLAVLGKYGKLDALLNPRQPFSWLLSPGTPSEVDGFLNGEKFVISDTNLN